MTMRAKRRVMAVAVFVVEMLIGGSLLHAEEPPTDAVASDTTISVGAPVYGLAFSPQGTLLATAGDNGVRLWDIKKYRESVRLEAADILRPEKGWYESDRSFHAPVFSPDGKLLAAAEYLPVEKGKRESAAGRYCVWDAASGKLRAQREFPIPLASLAFSPDGARLAVGDGASGFGVCEIPGGVTWYESGKSRVEPPISAVAFSPDGKLLVVADDPEEGRAYYSGAVHIPVPGADTTIQLIDPITKKKLRKISEKSSQGIHKLVFARDGKTLYAAYEDGRLRAWDVSSGKLASSYRMQSEPWYFTPIAFSSNGKWLAVRDCRDGPVVVWDLAAGRKVAAINISTDSGHRLAISNDGLLLAGLDVNDEEGVVLLWRCAKQAPKPRRSDTTWPTTSSQRSHYAIR